MNRSLIIAGVAFLSGFSFVAGQEPKAPEWAPLGVGVSRKPPAGLSTSLTAENNPETSATWISARLHLPMRFIAAVDIDKSELTAFTDDKGTDLLSMKKDAPADDKKAKLRLQKNHISTALRPLTPDGRFLTLTFRAADLPAPGAKKLRLIAKIAVEIGKDEKVFEKKEVILRNGVDLKVGILEWKAADLFGADGPGGFLIYRGSRPLKSLTLLDAEGKEIGFQNIIPSSNKNANPNGRFMTSFFPRSKVERCTVRAVYCDTLEKVMVPLDLEVGIGF